MKHRILRGAAMALVLAAVPLAAGATTVASTGTTTAQAQSFSVAPVYYKLPNGLKVILLKDSRIPTVTVAVHYGIGFRIEPQNRTGFAHLFEHLLFQGSENAPIRTLRSGAKKRP